MTELIDNKKVSFNIENFELIPMYIIVTKPTMQKYEKFEFICNSLDECYNKLIINFKNLIEMKADYPMDLDEFTLTYWHNDNSIHNNIFDYSIFYKNKWQKLWTEQELYERVIEIIYNVDMQNSIYTYYEDSKELADTD